MTDGPHLDLAMLKERGTEFPCRTFNQIQRSDAGML